MKITKYKKTAALLLAAVLTGSLCACEGGGGVEETAYNWSNVAIGGGGYVTGIVYSDTEEGLRYARTDIGGAYRWSSRDTQWVPITDHFGGVNAADWNLIGIESIATDPVEPNRVYIACGTYSTTNGAIICSEDYGETWTQADMPFPMGGNMSGRGVGERLMVNPKNNKQIFYGSRSDGLYVSNDYGKTWEQVTSFPVKGNYFQEKNQIGIMWIEFEPGSGDIYVGVAMKDGACIYRSSDNGASWEALPANTAGMYPMQAEFSENGYLYLCYGDSCGPNAATQNGMVCRYSIADGKFEDITPKCNDGRYGGFSGISVDGSDPNTIVCGTLGFWSKKGENLYRSTDGGVTWTPFFDNTADHYVMDVTEAPWLNWGRETAQTGWWMADVEIDPFDSNVVSWGTGATLYSTTNLTDLGSGTPVTVKFDAHGLEETAIFKVVSTPVQNGSPQLYSIMGDLTGFSHLDVTKRPDDAHFMKVGTSDDLAVAWNNGNIAAYTNDDLKQPLRYTTDGGATWNKCAGMPEATAGGKVAISADGSTMVWIAGNIKSSVYFTKDFGATWYISQGMGMDATVFADKLEPNVFYGVCGGTVYVSKDGGANFVATGVNLSENCEIVPSAEKQGFIWVRSGTMLGYSEDYGTTVTYLKDLSVNAIGVGKGEKDGDPMVLYVMGDIQQQGGGIYSTADHGKNWKKLTTDNEGFGNLTPSITGDASIYGRVYFATNGRGIVMGDLAS